MHEKVGHPPRTLPDGGALFTLTFPAGTPDPNAVAIPEPAAIG
jgi:hypothetical protein